MGLTKSNSLKLSIRRSKQLKKLLSCCFEFDDPQIFEIKIPDDAVGISECALRSRTLKYSTMCSIIFPIRPFLLSQDRNVTDIS